MSEDAPHYGTMTEQRARELLLGHIGPENSLQMSGLGWDSWRPGMAKIAMSSDLTADQLEAIAWWMRNKA